PSHICPLSLHDALPIFGVFASGGKGNGGGGRGGSGIVAEGGLGGNGAIVGLAAELIGDVQIESPGGNLTVAGNPSRPCTKNFKIDRQSPHPKPPHLPNS